MKQNSEDIFCAGFGGQGIIFMGKLLAQAALMAGRNVTWMPSYGAEVRGGTAYSMTRISDEEIGNPIINKPTILVAMNQPSLIKYQPLVQKGGVVIVNKSMSGNFEKRKDIEIVSAPLTELASKLGDTKVANIIAVGAVLNKTKFLSHRNVVYALEEFLAGRPEILQRNKDALERGYKIKH